MRRLAISILLVAACGGDDPGQELLEGFDPPAPGDGEIQILSPIVRDMAPGADVTLCSYLPLDVGFDETVDVVAGRGYQSPVGGHHGVLYMAQRERAVDTHECTDDDMINTRFLVGAGGGDAGGAYADIPEGIAYRVDGGRQLMIQTHWINTTTAPIDGQAAFNLRVQPPSGTVQLAQLFTWTSTDISVPANGTGAASSDCVVGQDLNFYILGGHAHEHGSRVTLTHTPVDGEPRVFYDQEWTAYYTFDPPRIELTLADAMAVHAGDTLTVDCTYANTTAEALTFPTEMCVGFGFFFPAEAQLDCVDGRWPQ